VAKRKWTSYSDEDKASAVLMLEAAGYPVRIGAMSQVVRELGVPESTLRSWAKQEHGAPPAKVRDRKRGELVQTLNEVAFKLLDHLGNIADTGDVKETATAFGIVVDKLQILNGEPTQTINQRILVEYADDEDIITQAAAVAERRYQDGTEI
jgi:hypothetical protein